MRGPMEPTDGRGPYPPVAAAVDPLPWIQDRTAVPCHPPQAHVRPAALGPRRPLRTRHLAPLEECMCVYALAVLCVILGRVYLRVSVYSIEAHAGSGIPRARQGRGGCSHVFRFLPLCQALDLFLCWTQCSFPYAHRAGNHPLCAHPTLFAPSLCS